MKTTEMNEQGFLTIPDDLPPEETERIKQEIRATVAQCTDDSRKGFENWYAKYRAEVRIPAYIKKMEPELCALLEQACRDFALAGWAARDTEMALANMQKRAGQRLIEMQAAADKTIESLMAENRQLRWTIENVLN